MMPEEWPIAAPAADQDVPARAAGRDRLRTVRVDFFLDPAARLSEQERALMTAMLHCLVGDIADEIRALVADLPTAANDQANLALIDLLLLARLLDRAGLVRLLLRRADEERIMTGAKARIGRRGARVIQGLVSHADGAIAAAAMALIIARGRRRDRFGQCLLHFDDLSRLEAGALANAVAAALRTEIAGAGGRAEADRQLSDAAAQLLASHDQGSSIESLTATLVRLLDEEADLTDELILAAAIEGEMNFVGHALGRRSGLDGETAMDELLCGDSTRVIVLLRVGRVRRETAAGLLAGIGDLLGISDPAGAIGEFDDLTDADAAGALSRLRADPAYKHALAILENDDGKRAL
jgi:hypothetical protein